ncbi:MAG TPA: TetR family transcriptional regulator [Bacteroidia bacterium]|jgi:AcrR family transcriptional regulator|nr:TetR family transcriptional regulator [Bacteroidia bacterium]
MSTDKREHILDTAQELFSQHGFEGTSVRVLANAAGVNVAMISYYFGSKEKLFQAMIERRAGATLMTLKFILANEADSWKKMEMVIEHYIDKMFSNMSFQRIMYRELSLEQRNWLSSAIIDIVHQNFKAMVSIIEEGQRKKSFRKVDPELTIATLIGTISKITLSSELSCKLLGDINPKASIGDETHKKRIKKHMHDLLKAHLLIPKK